jgi:hypothetical protein
MNVFLTYHGLNIPIVQGDVSTNEGAYAWQCNFVLRNVSDWANFAQDDIFTVTILAETFTFIVDGKQLERRGPGQIIAKIQGVSPSAKYNEPRVVLKQNYLFDTDVLASVAAVETIPDIQWATTDWLIPAFRLAFSLTVPFSVVKALADAVGAVLESTIDGFLRVRPKFPISVPYYSTATPDQIFLETTDIVSVSESYTTTAINNKFRVADVDQLINDSLEWVPDSSGAFHGQVRVYPHPWRTSGLVVTHTGDSGITIGSPSVVVRRETEQVEIVRGHGATRYPIYDVDLYRWESTNLGGFVFTQDQREFTVVAGGNGVVNLAYLTRAIVYPVTSVNALPTQFLLESPPFL